MVARRKHVEVVETRDSSPHVFLTSAETRALVVLPDTYYGRYDYATPNLFTEAVPASEDSTVRPQNFPVNASERFGLAKTMKLDLPAPTWVMTNCLAFPWIELAIDGAPVPADEVRAHFGKLTIRVPAGEHKVTMRFLAPLWWRILRVISLLGLLVWCVYLLAPEVLTVGRHVRDYAARFRSDSSNARATP